MQLEEQQPPDVDQVRALDIQVLEKDIKILYTLLSRLEESQDTEKIASMKVHMVNPLSEHRPSPSIFFSRSMGCGA